MKGRVGSDGVLIATPAQTTSTARGTIETRVAGSFGNVAQCLVFFCWTLQPVRP